MFYPDANDPYRQPAIPYQPYGGHDTQMMPQQNNVAASTSTTRAVPPYPAQARSKQARPVTPRKSKAETLTFVHECYWVAWLLGMRSELHLIRQLQQIIHLLHLLLRMVEMVDFSISNLDSSSSKVGEEMALEIIILHNPLFPVLIPPEPLDVLHWDRYWL